MVAQDTRPRGVWVAAGFFAIGGLLEVLFAVFGPQPISFWPLWEALGRSSLHLLLAAGLWQRLAVCRSIAMIYCVAVLVTYALVLALAFAHAAVAFPLPVILDSLYQVPSCALLYPYLRSAEASLLFTRPLLGR